jgi:hypothetical protein
MLRSKTTGRTLHASRMLAGCCMATLGQMYCGHALVAWPSQPGQVENSGGKSHKEIRTSVDGGGKIGWQRERPSSGILWISRSLGCIRICPTKGQCQRRPPLSQQHQWAPPLPPQHQRKPPLLPQYPTMQAPLYPRRPGSGAQGVRPATHRAARLNTCPECDVSGHSTRSRSTRTLMLVGQITSEPLSKPVETQSGRDLPTYQFLERCDCSCRYAPHRGSSTTSLMPSMPGSIT